MGDRREVIYTRKQHYTTLRTCLHLIELRGKSLKGTFSEALDTLLRASIQSESN